MPAAASSPPDSTSSEAHRSTVISLPEYLRALWSVRAWFIGAVVLFVAFAAVWAWAAPRVYEATATLRLIGAVDPRGEQRSPIAAAAALLRTHDLAADAITSLGLDKPPYRLSPTDLFESTVIIREVAPDLLIVSARLNDPRRAAELANHLADAGVRASGALGVDDAAVAIAQLTRQLEVARERLAHAEARLLTFRRQAQLDLLRSDVDALLEQRQRRNERGTVAEVPQLATLYERELEQARLQVEYDAASRVYGELFARHEEASIAADTRGNALRIVSKAYEPSTPVRPRPTVLMAAGGAIGVIAGALAGVVKMLASA